MGGSAGSAAASRKLTGMDYALQLIWQKFKKTQPRSGGPGRNPLSRRSSAASLLGAFITSAATADHAVEMRMNLVGQNRPCGQVGTDTLCGPIPQSELNSNTSVFVRTTSFPPNSGLPSFGKNTAPSEESPDSNLVVPNARTLAAAAAFSLVPPNASAD